MPKPSASGIRHGPRFLAARDATRQIFHLDWKARQLRIATLCMPAIALVLLTGFLLNQMGPALVAAGGAMTVGFGALQRFSQGWSRPMLGALLGMTLSTLAGSLLGHSAWGQVPAAGLLAAVCGLLNVVGTGAWWIALQWNVTLAVAGAYPSGWEAAVGRALLVMAGGGVQWALLAALQRHFPPMEPWPPGRQVPSAWRAVREAIRWNAPDGRYAVRLAVAAMTASALARGTGLPSGYWATMTAVVVMKPTLRETSARGVQRVAGTVLGAGAATLGAALLHPGHPALAVAVLVLAWLSYALQKVSYAALSTAITAYVVTLIALGDTPEVLTALHRVVATLVGSAIALLVDALFWGATHWNRTPWSGWFRRLAHTRRSRG